MSPGEGFRKTRRSALDLIPSDTLLPKTKDDEISEPFPFRDVGDSTGKGDVYQCPFPGFTAYVETASDAFGSLTHARETEVPSVVGKERIWAQPDSIIFNRHPKTIGREGQSKSQSFRLGVLA